MRAFIYPMKPQNGGAELYKCVIDGKVVAKHTTTPELTLARAFIERDWFGWFEVWGPNKHGYFCHRSTVDAAKIVWLAESHAKKRK